MSKPKFSDDQKVHAFNIWIEHQDELTHTHVQGGKVGACIDCCVLALVRFWDHRASWNPVGSNGASTPRGRKILPERPDRLHYYELAELILPKGRNEHDPQIQMDKVSVRYHTVCDACEGGEEGQFERDRAAALSSIDGVELTFLGNECWLFETEDEGIAKDLCFMRSAEYFDPDGRSDADPVELSCDHWLDSAWISVLSNENTFEDLAGFKGSVALWFEAQAQHRGEFNTGVARAKLAREQAVIHQMAWERARQRAGLTI